MWRMPSPHTHPPEPDHVQPVPKPSATPPSQKLLSQHAAAQCDPSPTVLALSRGRVKEPSAHANRVNPCEHARPAGRKARRERPGQRHWAPRTTRHCGQPTAEKVFSKKLSARQKPQNAARTFTDRRPSPRPRRPERPTTETARVRPAGPPQQRRPPPPQRRLKSSPGIGLPAGGLRLPTPPPAAKPVME